MSTLCSDELKTGNVMPTKIHLFRSEMLCVKLGESFRTIIIISVAKYNSLNIV